MIELKIGRHTYNITENDKFMDNGACVQLLTQSKRAMMGYSRPSPVLTKANIKQLDKYEKIIKPYSTGVVTFTLKFED